MKSRRKKGDIVEILPGGYALGLSLWLEKPRVLVVADFHIGYEESLNLEGVLVPRVQFKETKAMLESIFCRVKTKEVVIAGDLKHEFGQISSQEWREALAVFDFLAARCKKVTLLKGNHDTVLGQIAKKRKLDVKDFVCFGKICVVHGDRLLEDKEIKKSEVLVIGHEHPAVSLREGVKSELYKCFLVGNYGGRKLIVLPSFLPIVEGVDIRKEKLLSPYLQGSLEDFEVYVVGDKIYRFGKLGEMK